MHRHIGSLKRSANFRKTSVHEDNLFYAVKPLMKSMRGFRLFRGRTDSSKYCDAPVFELAHHNMPPACCIKSFESTCNDKKSNTKWCWIFCGGGGRIRTIEAKRSRFTVCPLWPLGNSPIFDSVELESRLEPIDGLEPPTY